MSVLSFLQQQLAYGHMSPPTPPPPTGSVLCHSDQAVEGLSASRIEEPCVCEGAGDTGVCIWLCVVGGWVSVLW